MLCQLFELQLEQTPSEQEEQPEPDRSAPRVWMGVNILWQLAVPHSGHEGSRVSFIPFEISKIRPHLPHL